MLCGRGNLLYFRESLCFIISAIEAVSSFGAFTSRVTAKNTLPLAPGTERGAWRFTRSSLGVGPATVRLGPSLFLSRKSGRLLGRWVLQNEAGGV